MVSKIVALIQKSKSAVFPIAGTLIAGVSQAIVVLMFTSS